jgi:hypothetical protein
MKTRSILALLVSLGLGAAVSAQTKSSGTQQCAKPDPFHAVEVGDHPGHVYAVAKVACTWTKPMDLAGITTKEGTSVVTSEIHGDKATDNGSYWSTMSNGDKIFVQFHGSTTLDKDGNPQSISGHWSYTGGTGKMKGLKGKGTYSGKAGADGSMTEEIEGDYTLPASK